MSVEISTETQASIAKWAQETFGPAPDPSVLVKRAHLELDELLEAVASGDIGEIGAETADVLILLYRLLEIHSLDAQNVTTKKMQENRTRQWQRKGDGTGSHIK